MSASAVLLAAGASRRMGGVNKLALRVDNEPLVRRTLDTLLRAGVGEVVVVLGHDAERIEALVARPGVRCVRNAQWAEGQQRSVLAGLAALAGGDGPVMIVLGDLPLLAAADLVALLAAFDARGEGVEVVQPWHRGRRGNPVVASRAAVREVLAHADIHAGLRGWIDAHPASVARWEAAGDGFCFDLDTPRDIEELERRLGRRVAGWRDTGTGQESEH